MHFFNISLRVRQILALLLESYFRDPYTNYVKKIKNEHAKWLLHRCKIQKIGMRAFFQN